MIVSSSLLAAERKLIKDGDRVVFLGDSNTYAGKFIAYLTANCWSAEHSVDKAAKRQPVRNVEFLNLGLSSETASGLSEPDHPFPRPCVIDRIDRALEQTKPDVVVACYGINDAIYYPFDGDRFMAFQKGIRQIIDKTKAVGAKIVIVCPPPFDALPLKSGGKLRPKDAEKFAWFAPYEDYDDVMAKYAAWELKLHDADRVIDLHRLTHLKLAAERKEDPQYTFAKDGVHFNDLGHRFVADVFVTQLGLVPGAPVGNETMELISKRQIVLRNAWLSHVGHKRPGIKKGLPIGEANAEADKLQAKITNLLKGELAVAK